MYIGLPYAYIAPYAVEVLYPSALIVTFHTNCHQTLMCMMYSHEQVTNYALQFSFLLWSKMRDYIVRISARK